MRLTPSLSFQRVNDFSILTTYSNSNIKKRSLIRTACITEGVLFHNDGVLPCTPQDQMCEVPVSLANKNRRMKSKFGRDNSVINKGQITTCH